MKHRFLKKFTALLLGTIMVLSLIPATLFTVNAAELNLTLCTGTLKAGDKVVIATPKLTKGVTGWNNSKDATLSTEQGNWVQYTVAVSGSAYTFYDENAKQYIASPGTTNQFGYGSEAGTITINSNGQIVINDRFLQINGQYIRCYSSINSSYTGMCVYIVNTATEHQHVDDDKNCACDVDGCVYTFDHVDENSDCTCDNCTTQLEHNYVDGVCSVCRDEVEGCVLVTDVADLAIGDKIIIVAAGYDYALSTEQKTNNRGQAAITKNEKTVSYVDGVQVITLEAVEDYDGAPEGQKLYAFNTGNGYLYAASSSNNYLKTQATNNANGHWTISIDAFGVASIVAQGTNIRNTLQYNQTSSLFACYASASQKAVSIYKLVEETTEPEEPKITGFSLSLNKGITIKVKLTIDQAYINANQNEKVRFSNGVTFDPVAGTSEYTVDLKPTEFNSDITISYGSLEDKDVSVAKYTALVNNDDSASAELKALVAAIAAYSEALNPTENDELLVESFDSVTNLAVKKYLDLDPNFGIQMGANVSNYVSIEYTFLNYDVNKFVITKDGADYASGDIANNQLVINNIYPLNYNDEFELTVLNDTTEVATITFTFNAYLKLLANSTDGPDHNLAVAIYRYGLAVEEYNATK